MMTSHPPARPVARSVGGSVAAASASPPPSFAATEEDSLITWAARGRGLTWAGLFVSTVLLAFLLGIHSKL